MNSGSGGHGSSGDTSQKEMPRLLTAKLTAKSTSAYFLDFVFIFFYTILVARGKEERN